MARQFTPYLTAAEAFPALEREFLNAKTRISAGFRIFDPWTLLHSDDAKAFGDTWFDLIVATLNRGIKIKLIISDFDPVIRPDAHAYTWSCIRALFAAGQASHAPHLLIITADMHAARVGILPRLVLWPRLFREIRKSAEHLNTLQQQQRDKRLSILPRLRPKFYTRDGKIFARRFPPPPLVPATHHQKLAVFDRQRLYIGGLDLNNRRFDTLDHHQSADETWHDTQVIVDGLAAAEAAQHLDGFQAENAGGKPTKFQHLIRTVSSVRKWNWPFLSPQSVDNTLARQHAKNIKQAKHLIYLETQYFRDRTLAKQLAARARAIPDLSLILILPAAPEDVAFENNAGSDAAYGEHLQVQCLKIVRQAFGSRVFVGSPVQQRSSNENSRATSCGSPLIYLHAKVSIFDDTAAIVSSANLNGRSLAWDTETGIATLSTDEVAQLKNRCFKHWLDDTADDRFYRLDTACAAWSKCAHDNAKLPPDQRKGFIVPYAVAPAEDIASNLPGVPEEMV